MNQRLPIRALAVLAVLLLVFLLAGCAVYGAATEAASEKGQSNTALSGGGRVPATSAPGVFLSGDTAGMAQPTMALAPAAESGATGAIPSDSGSAVGATSLIIKQGQIRLLVKDTDQSIDRLTQIVSDSGGYIVSNSVWVEPFREENYKYASFTIAVPVDQFENALRRLRDLSLRVLDESATGQDVSQEYVDLQSRLTNLEATRDRIRGFLAQAQTVDDSLRINQELSAIEDQIEQVKGRMNYLSGRAAYSTISVQLEPELPAIPSPTPTPTPTPTPSPAGWDPGKTFEHAGGLATKAAQFLVDAAIYLVVWLPFAVPVLIVWGIYKIVTRKKKVV